ncbi:transcriptional regulator [Nitratidesulfovibrio sp. 1201_IL3209]|uniref:transcriptional regulator n=1 Tax=Nitratidesulfovibrio sp. 1201_IL3209 TaxID=3084053 RepID=UPI002FDA7890
MGVQEVVTVAMARAQDAVDYIPRTGATCPVCGAQRLRVVCTKPWIGNVRVRFHRCTNPACVMGKLGLSIKSVQDG